MQSWIWLCSGVMVSAIGGLGWWPAAAQQPAAPAGGVDYLAQRADFDPADSGLDESSESSSDPATDASGSADDGGRSNQAGSSSGSEPVGDEAPVEDVVVPELDNQELLAGLDLRTAQQELKRYADGTLKARVQTKTTAGQNWCGMASMWNSMLRTAASFATECTWTTSGTAYGSSITQLASWRRLANMKKTERQAPGIILREDGSLERTEIYDKGLQTGRWLTFAMDGKTVLRIRSFTGGEASGVWHGWYNPARKNFEMSFRDGKQHGMNRAWYPDGNRWFQGNYVDGKKDGEWIWWDRGGRGAETQPLGIRPPNSGTGDSWQRRSRVSAATAGGSYPRSACEDPRHGLRTVGVMVKEEPQWVATLGAFWLDRVSAGPAGGGRGGSGGRRLSLHHAHRWRQESLLSNAVVDAGRRDDCHLAVDCLNEGPGRPVAAARDCRDVHQ